MRAARKAVAPMRLAHGTRETEVGSFYARGNTGPKLSLSGAMPWSAEHCVASIGNILP